MLALMLALLSTRGSLTGASSSPPLYHMRPAPKAQLPPPPPALWALRDLGRGGSPSAIDRSPARAELRLHAARRGRPFPLGAPELLERFHPLNPRAAPMRASLSFLFFVSLACQRLHSSRFSEPYCPSRPREFPLPRPWFLRIKSSFPRWHLYNFSLIRKGRGPAVSYGGAAHTRPPARGP